MKVLQVSNLSKKIKDHLILDNINFEVEGGDFIGIVGRNASGKSMLFKAITGLIHFSGEVSIFNKRVGVKGSIPEDTGCLIERPGFIAQYSGFTNLKFLAGIKRIITDNEIKVLMEKLGLDANDRRPYYKYSLGMKQKLGIAQAIMEKPKMILLDEPMNNLDEESILSMRNIFQDMNQAGITFILTSHNKMDIDFLCNQVFTINNGKLYYNEG